MIETISKEKLTPCEWEVRPHDMGKWAVILISGEAEQVTGVFSHRKDAEDAVAKARKMLQPNEKRQRRESRRSVLTAESKEAFQLFVMQMDTMRCGHFVEHSRMLSFLCHMITYVFDEAETYFDECLDKGIRQRLTNARKDIEGLIDAVLETKALGETQEQYNRIAVDAHRIKNVLNTLVNFGPIATGENYLLTSVENTINSGLRKEAAEEFRKQSGENLQAFLRSTFAEHAVPTCKKEK